MFGIRRLLIPAATLLALPFARSRGEEKNVRAIAVYNPITYIADGLHGLIITPGLDWPVVGFAFLIIGAVGFVTLSATTTMFRRAVST